MIRFVRRSFYGILPAALGVLLSTVAFANPVYNPVIDLTTGANPQGVWTLGSESALGGTFTPFTSYNANCFSTTGLQSYFGPASGGNCLVGPFIIRNNTGSTFTLNGGGGGLIQPQTELNMVPNNTLFSVLRFTAPTSDLYVINGYFRGIDFTPTSVDTHVLFNNVDNLPSTVNDFGPPHWFSFSRNITAGTTIDFVVGSETGNSNNDSTGFAATITTAPEPAAAGLLAIGFGGLLVLRKRKARV